MKIKIMMMLAAVLMIGMAGGQSYQGATTFDGQITAEAGIDMAGTDLESWIGSSRAEMVEWDAYIRIADGGGYIASLANGSTVGASSGDFGVVANGLIDELRGATTTCKAAILVDINGVVYTTTPVILYNGTRISGLPAGIMSISSYRTTISTSANSPIFQTNNSFQNRNIHISDLALISSRTGTDYYTSSQILLYRTGYSTVERVHTYESCDYDSSVVGGVSFDGTGDATNWLNVVQDSHLSSLRLKSTHDSLVERNIFCSFGKSKFNLVINGCNNLRILRNHFVISTTGSSSVGIFVASGTPIYMNRIEQNMFESANSVSGGDEYGVLSDSAFERGSISQNVFVALGMMGINLNGGMSYSIVNENTFSNCNVANSSVGRAISINGGSYNSVSHNIGYNTISTTKAPFIQGGVNYTSYVGNVIHGKFLDDIYDVGTGSVETGTIATLT